MGERIVLEVEGPNAVLRGGPVDGARVRASSASYVVAGEKHDRPAMVALYRWTRQREEDLTVFRFDGWEEVFLPIPRVSYDTREA